MSDKSPKELARELVSQSRQNAEAVGLAAELVLRELADRPELHDNGYHVAMDPADLTTLRMAGLETDSRSLRRHVGRIRIERELRSKAGKRADRARAHADFTEAEKTARTKGAELQQQIDALTAELNQVNNAAIEARRVYETMAEAAEQLKQYAPPYVATRAEIAKRCARAGAGELPSEAADRIIGAWIERGLTIDENTAAA